MDGKVLFCGAARSPRPTSVVLLVADGGSRLGHVMIGPLDGLTYDNACSVADHPEREELLSSRVDRDDFRLSTTFSIL